MFPVNPGPSGGARVLARSDDWQGPEPRAAQPSALPDGRHRRIVVRKAARAAVPLGRGSKHHLPIPQRVSARSAHDVGPPGKPPMGCDLGWEDTLRSWACECARIEPAAMASYSVCWRQRCLAACGIIVSMDQPPVVTQEQRIDALVARSRWQQGVPIRHGFVQRGPRTRPEPGPLKHLVAHHDDRAFDLYMLARLIGKKEPFKVELEAGVWAGALGLRGPSGPATVSRAWRRLSDLKLVERGRKGRLASVTLLREDGSGDPYTSLAPKGDPWFEVPLEYWTDRWFERMDVPTKAMLLIALSLQDGFYLPSDKAGRWYGLSPDTAERGLTKLRELGLLDRKWQYKLTPLTAQGWTRVYHYTLKAPFGPKAARKRAAVVEKKGVRLKVV